MLDFMLRASTLLLRFACPLLILAISSAENLGRYYLFISYLTLTATLIATELASVHSGQYLRSRSNSRKAKVFRIFSNNTTVVSSTLSIPATLTYFLTIPTPFIELPLVIMLFTTEACVNEIGRFYWNVGLHAQACRRDLLRAISFTLGIIISTVISGEAVHWIGILIISIGNAMILRFDSKLLGMGRYSFRTPSKRYLGKLYNVIKKSMAQVIQTQTTSVQVFIERLLIERQLGLSYVAAYSFQYSIIQTSATLYVWPKISKVRESIFESKTNNHQAEILNLLFLITISFSAIGIMLSALLPYAQQYTDKLAETSLLIILVATISSISSTFCNAVSPNYCKDKALKITLSVFAITSLFLIYQSYAGTLSQEGVLVSIIFVAFIQAFARVKFA
jgi:hypothetical protein